MKRFFRLHFKMKRFFKWKGFWVFLKSTNEMKMKRKGFRATPESQTKFEICSILVVLLVFEFPSVEYKISDNFTSKPTYLLKWKFAIMYLKRMIHRQTNKNIKFSKFRSDDQLLSLTSFIESSFEKLYLVELCPILFSLSFC